MECLSEYRDSIPLFGIVHLLGERIRSQMEKKFATSLGSAEADSLSDFGMHRLWPAE